MSQKCYIKTQTQVICHHKYFIVAYPVFFSTAHPYQYELDHFKPNPSVLLPVDLPTYKPLDAIHVTLVDTVSQLHELSSTLDAQKEFAVDLEVGWNSTFQL